jgi:hypothetical protein
LAATIAPAETDGGSLQAMRIIALPGAGLLLLLLLPLLIGAPRPTAAEEPGTTAVPPVESADLLIADQPPAGPPLDAATAATLGQALSFDPAALAPDATAKTLAIPDLKPAALDVSGNDTPDGSSSIAIKQPLPTTDWDSKVGVDLKTAAPTVTYQPGEPLPGAQSDNSGAAWASVGLPNLASLDARVDAGSDQGRFGTTLQHSMPLGGNFSFTLRDSFAASDSLGVMEQTPSALAGLPMMALPQTSTSASTDPVWSNQPGVKLDILSTGTTLAANLASSSSDPVTHNTLSAQQRIYGPLHVTTSVTDLGEATVNQSITAELKLNW